MVLKCINSEIKHNTRILLTSQLHEIDPKALLFTLINCMMVQFNEDNIGDFINTAVQKQAVVIW